MTVTAPFPLATLEATLERVTYANEANGYTVAKVDPGRGGDLVTVVGSLLGADSCDKVPRAISALDLSGPRAPSPLVDRAEGSSESDDRTSGLPDRLSPEHSC